MRITRDLKKRRFWAKLSTQTFAAFGLLSAGAGVTDALIPGSLAPVGGFLLIAVAIASVIYGLIRAWPRPVQQSYSSPSTEIYITEGDLFGQDGHVVIGMTDTFDTAIPHIIDQNSVQAQLLKRAYLGDTQRLDDDLNKALEGKPSAGAFQPADSKPGKQNRYQLGTVAVLEPAIRKLYFCVAYTKMNKRNEARATVDGIWRCLNSLWDEVRARSNGEPVSMGVIGGGQARISQHLPPQDAVRLTAMSFMFASREERVTSRLNIVVRPEVARDLDMLELQAFLKSLRPS
ncbi:macro domain-containing protein [Amycolatopsis sp. NPDC051758]|uniref:macro domain-containing protein n=1 Tax=Amycolatopsis sp. NPDC051758 TaxID=3363935 RepID=UPI0037A021B3